jgi:hypothetical protein
MRVREQGSDQLAYAIRGMLGRPAFSMVVIATIALGVGANTAMFSVGVVLPRAPRDVGESDGSAAHVTKSASL